MIFVWLKSIYLSFLVGPEEFSPNAHLGQEERVLPYEENLGLDNVEGHGRFIHDFLDFNLLDYEVIRSQGSSCLSKAMALPLPQLEALVMECRTLPPVEIKEKVELLKSRDLEIVIDGTYM